MQSSKRKGSGTDNIYYKVMTAIMSQTLLIKLARWIHFITDFWCWANSWIPIYLGKKSAVRGGGPDWSYRWSGTGLRSAI